MHFTVEKNNLIDKVINKDLTKIKKELRQHLGSSIEALILVGGFGRGEGTVIKTKTGYEPVNDYDIIIVSNKFLPKKLPKKISENLARKLRIRFIDLSIVSKHFLKFSRNTMFNYDTIHGGYVFYGNGTVLNQYREFLQIPKRTGEILLFNRSIAFFELIKKKDFISKETDLKTFLQLGKAIMACGDCLLVYAEEYNHSYKERSLLFQRLKGIKAKYKQLVLQATNLKLRPSRTKLPSFNDFFYEGINFFLTTLSKIYSCRLDIKAILYEHNTRSKEYFLREDFVKKILGRRSFSYYELEEDTIKLMYSCSKQFKDNGLRQLAKKYKVRCDQDNLLDTFLEIKDRVVKRWMQVRH